MSLWPLPCTDVRLLLDVCKLTIELPLLGSQRLGNGNLDANYVVASTPLSHHLSTFPSKSHLGPVLTPGGYGDILSATFKKGDQDCRADRRFGRGYAHNVIERTPLPLKSRISLNGYEEIQIA